MKTKKLVAVAMMLSVSYISVIGQNNNIVTEEKSAAFHFEIPDDPKLTQADIEMLMEAAKGAPAKAEPVNDERAPALSEEQLKAEGVYYLAPANAQPIDDEAEYQRWLLHHEKVMAATTQSEAVPFPAQDRQSIPELTAPVREVAKPDVNHIQPPGEIPPKREKTESEAPSGGQRGQQPLE